jgi:hypothetical protein
LKKTKSRSPRTPTTERRKRFEELCPEASLFSEVQQEPVYGESHVEPELVTATDQTAEMRSYVRVLEKTRLDVVYLHDDCLGRTVGIAVRPGTPLATVRAIAKRQIAYFRGVRQIDFDAFKIMGRELGKAKFDELSARYEESKRRKG